MAYSRKFQTYLGFALMLSMLSFVPTPSWAGCKNSGGSSAGHKVGSQVSGSSVTICAAAVLITPARIAVVKVVAKKVVTVKTVKAVAKPAPKVWAAISKKPSVGKIPASLASRPKIKTVIKVAKKSKVIKKPGSSNLTNDSANFEPATINGAVYPSSQLSVGQTATFSAPAYVHYRSGILLSLPTEVRFTPISVSWELGDGSSGAGATLEYAFDASGSYPVTVKVVYAVAYRVKGSSAWIAEPDTISMADALTITVSAETTSVNEEAPAKVPRRVLLVGADCLTRPGTFGCS